MDLNFWWSVWVCFNKWNQVQLHKTHLRFLARRLTCTINKKVTIIILQNRNFLGWMKMIWNFLFYIYYLFFCCFTLKLKITFFDLIWNIVTMIKIKAEPSVATRGQQSSLRSRCFFSSSFLPFRWVLDFTWCRSEASDLRGDLRSERSS